MSGGVLNGVEHDMLKVTINGVEYYSDPTNYDSGVVGVLGMTPGYREDSCGGGLVTANYSTGLIQVLIVILFYVWKLISWYGSYCK